MSVNLVLPGEILHPNWPGTRCKECGRPMGGDGVYEGWATCDDVPQTHNTMDQVPADVLNKHYRDRVWSVAMRTGLPKAIRYMTKHNDELGGSPLDLCESGEGEKVLRSLHTKNEILDKELAGSRGIQL